MASGILRGRKPDDSSNVTQAVKEVVRKEVKAHEEDENHFTLAYIRAMVKDAVKEILKDAIVQHRANSWHPTPSEVRNIAKSVLIAATAQHYEPVPNTDQCITRAGTPWTDWEQDQLIDECETAIRKIAEKHNRTTGAIKSRIHQIIRGG